GYGFLITFVGLRAVCGALTLATLGARVRRGELFTVCGFTVDALMLLFSFVDDRRIASGVLFFLGLTMLINGALANGILQSAVPDELRGRVMAAYVFFYVGFTPIGSLIAGALARATSVQWAIGTGALIMLAYSAIAFWKVPELRRV